MFEPVAQLQERERKKNPKGERADHALGRSRGGYGTKLHLVTDVNGVPLAVEISPGEAHESKFVEPVMKSICIKAKKKGPPRTKPKRLLGDKGYSIPRVRNYLKSRAIKAVIPKKSNEKYKRKDFDKVTYRKRNAIERCVGWLKENRRLGTRYEKYGVNFLAMAKLAIVQRYLRVLDSSDRT